MSGRRTLQGLVLIGLLGATYGFGYKMASTNNRIKVLEAAGKELSSVESLKCYLILKK